MTICSYPDYAATTGYKRGCRCTHCTDGHAAYLRRYRAGQISNQTRPNSREQTMDRFTRNLTQPGAWAENVPCKTRTNIFFPETGTAGIDEARATCATCPAQARCLHLALIDNEQFGVWGGTSVKERRVLRRNPALMAEAAAAAEAEEQQDKPGRVA